VTDYENHAGMRPGAWREGWDEGADSLFTDREQAEDHAEYRTLTYEVTGRIARITFDRPEHGNAITADTPLELAATVERADLDPRVHVILLSGRGKGFWETDRTGPPARCSIRWCRRAITIRSATGIRWRITR
jgi:enoyl-CoA hydratase